MAKHKRSGPEVGLLILLAIILYVAVAGITFAVRHPWMTDTERALYTWRMLTFGTVDYEEARPREHR